MTTEKMTVHKALAELKVLDDRILAAIGACNLITTKKNNQDKVRGKTVAEFTADAKSAYDKATDLIKRRNAIKDKDAKTNGDEFDASVRTYIKSNSMELIDPVGLEKRIEELDSMITAFMTEIDAALSVSNALTTIEITY